MFTLSGAAFGAVVVLANAPDPVDWQRASFVLAACAFVGWVCDTLWRTNP